MSSERRQLDITHEASAMPRTMYDERFLVPMRRDLTEVGFTELKTSDEVDAALNDKPGTAMVLVNSVCGCSARMARPAARIAVGHDPKPDRFYTVFAGQDADATARARSYFTGYPPSSPSIAILRDGKLVWMMERWQIEGRPAEEIAEELVEAFDKHCASD
jgi:putative YphP/YqiW family bacilliredoxin